MKTWWFEEISNPKAYEKALTAAITPLSIDRDARTGEFNGKSNTSSEPYHVTLDRCTCGAHGKPERPCKHMYRLAMELGLLPGDFKSDKAQIRISAYQRQSGGFEFNDFVELVESVSEDAQLALREYFRKGRCKPIAFKPLKRQLHVFAELVGVGIMAECEPGRFVLTENALYHCHPVNTYLMCKYEDVSPYKEHMPSDCPYGAEPVELVDLETGEIGYFMAFSNPRIDDLLTAHNCNRLNPPRKVRLNASGVWEWA